MPALAVTLWVAIASGVLSALSALVVVITVRIRERKSSPGGPGANDPWLLRAPLLALVLAVVAGLVAAYSLILHYAFGALDFHLPARSNITSPIVVAATLIAGTLTAAYAVLKLRAHLITEAKGKLDAHGEMRAGEKHRNDQEAAFSERFARAVSLLADPHPISRIAGAHLILAVGDEWKSQGAQQRCFDVLLSHLRGLNQSESFDNKSESRSSREEVRLITSEVIRRLAGSGPAWKVIAGDFSGTVVADFDLTDIRRFARLDLRDTHVLGDLSIPSTASATAPQLSEIVCEGDLAVEIDASWGDLSLSNADVGGSVSLTTLGDNRTLTASLDASSLVAGGDLHLAFELFLDDVVLDSASIAGVILAGSSELRASFGTKTDPVTLSAAAAKFQTFILRRADSGPRLDLSDAVGAVDLSGTTFFVEVTANRLDATDGLQIKGANFQGPLVLDGAHTPKRIDLDGVVLSKTAKSAIISSDFELRDQLLSLDEVTPPNRAFDHEVVFDWRTAIAPYRERCSPALLDEIDTRFSRLEADLPVDWHTRPTFTAKVMSEVSRAVAKVDESQEVEDALHAALRGALPLASADQEFV